MARFRRLARDYERLAKTLAGLHFIAFAMLMAQRFITFMTQNALQVLAVRGITARFHDSDNSIIKRARFAEILPAFGLSRQRS